MVVDPLDLFESHGGAVLRRQVEDGEIRDITDELADVIAAVPPGLLAPYTTDGKAHGLPYHVDPLGIWYNRALFAQAALDPERPPQTWAEFLDAVDALKRADVTPVAIGFADRWPVLCWYGCLAARIAGVEGFVEAGRHRSLLADPGFVHAAELLSEFVAREPIQPEYRGARDDDQTRLVATGQAAMELNGGRAPSAYEREAPGGLGDDLGWFPFPVVDGGRGTSGDVYGSIRGFAVNSRAPGSTLKLLRSLYETDNYARILASEPEHVPVLPGFDVADAHLAPLARAAREASAVVPDFYEQMPLSTAGELEFGIYRVADRGDSAEEVLEEVTEHWQRAPG